MMTASRRAKRVTVILDEKVRARLRGDEGPDHSGSASSGSEHEGASPALSTLLNGFFFGINDDGDHSSKDRDDDDRDADFSGGRGSEGSDDDGERTRKSPLFSSRPFPSAAMVRDLMRPPPADRPRADLIVDVTAAARRHEALRPDGEAFRRAVMGHLREGGHNAGICKSRWDRDGGATAGSYEYIDVLASGVEADQRYVVDLDFAAEFEIARPTAEYEEVLRALPGAYVGMAEELRRAVRVLAEEARRSMATRGLHVPPWRKLRYLQAKWLGPYRRTTNPVPSRPSLASPFSAAAAAPGRVAPWPAACRAVGFEPVRILIPPAA